MKHVRSIALAVLIAAFMGAHAHAEDNPNTRAIQGFINSLCMMLGIPTDSPQCPRAEMLVESATETPTPEPTPTPVSGPAISFDFYRAGDVTGGRYTCYVPSSSVRIEKLLMVTTIYFADGRVSRFNSGPIDGGFDRDCPRSLSIMSAPTRYKAYIPRSFPWRSVLGTNTTARRKRALSRAVTFPAI